MQAILKQVIAVIALLVTVNASAQSTDHILSGRFTDNVIAQVRVFKTGTDKRQSVAEYKISPANKNFLLVIQGNPVGTYRFQVTLYKPGGRHPKFDRIVVFPLTLNAGKAYSLALTSFKLDSAKKTGIELKEVASKSAVAVIKGKVINTVIKTGLPISLEYVADGALETTSTFNTDSDGVFAVPASVKQEGFYYLTSPRYRVRVYLKPADKLQMDIDQKTGLMNFIDGSLENKILYQWQQLILPITSYGYNQGVGRVNSFDINSYIDTYKKLRPAMDEFTSNFDCTNARFMQAFTNATDIDKDIIPINLLYRYSPNKIKGYPTTIRDFKEVPEFYHGFIQPGKFSNASVLLLGEARELMNLYAKMNVAILPKEKRETLSRAEKLEVMMNSISNDTLKSLLFNDQMAQMEISNLSEFRENFEPFKKYARTAPAKNTYEGIYNLYSGDTAFIGKSAHNFSLPDTSGKMVSMKDFKGKVVFIDVWATWCGPCRGQFPFMKAIEEEYHDNKDIVFVGISTDKAEVKDKWLAMVRKENLGGIQLLDDFGKSFGRKYKINAIPRFLLIDKQGRWVEIRCPLPEAKANLKRYLDKALQDGNELSAKN